MFEIGCSRRSVLASIAALAGVSISGGTLFTFATAPVAALDGDPVAFEAGDVPTVVSNDGRIESIYLSPTIDVRWNHFGRGVETIDLTVAVGNESGVDIASRASLTTTADEVESVAGIATGPDTDGFDDREGSIHVTFDRVDVTETGDAVTTETVSDPDLPAGESTSTSIDVVLRADLTGFEGESETIVETTSFDVSVRNPDGVVDVGGQANPEAA